MNAVICPMQTRNFTILKPKSSLSYAADLSMRSGYDCPGIGNSTVADRGCLFLGVSGKERFHFRKFVFRALFREGLGYAVYGVHFRRVAEKITKSGLFENNGAWQGKDGYDIVAENRRSVTWTWP